MSGSGSGPGPGSGFGLGFGRLPKVHRPDPAAGAVPLPPERKWRAIALATVLLAVAYWSMLAGLVSLASDEDGGGGGGGAQAGGAIALGLSLIPFVFVALAFLSEHPRASTAVLKAMGLALLVGIPVSAVAADAVTGIVAGAGAGGIAALRADEAHEWRTRAIALAFATAYTFVLVRTIGAVALLPAPIFPFTALGLADHYAERREGRGATVPGSRNGRRSPWHR
jgi:hypothetical protein